MVKLEISNASIKVFLTVTGIVAYAVLLNHVNFSGKPSILGMCLALMPLVLAGITLIKKRRANPLGYGFLLASALLALCFHQIIAQHASLIFLAQDVGLMLTLCFIFGLTLLPGNKPLCVQFAEMMHGTISLRHKEYALKVTIAWAIFFACMALANVVIYYFATIAIWSVFANFLTLPLIGLMFVLEFMVRKQVMLGEAGKFSDALHAYFDNARRSN